MTTPGSNLLRQALTVIKPQPVTWYKAAGRTLNNIGQDVPYYEGAQSILGSFQPVPRNLYQTLGLDLQKEYFDFFAYYPLEDVKRDFSSDLLVFHGRWYQCESADAWFGIDGWLEMRCVFILNPPVWINEPPIFGFDGPGSGYVGFDQGRFSPGQDG